MITKVVMPQLSLSMREGVVTKWLKKEGDFVEAGEVLCEFEADKASSEIEAPVSGYVLKIVAKEGEEFPVRQVMIYLGDRDDTISDPGEDTEIKATPVSKLTKISEERQDRKTGRILASPVAKRLASELGIDLSKVKGTGQDGMISKEDVLNAQERFSNAEPSSSDKDVRTELKGIKKIVAERMKDSYLDAPHFRLTLSCDMSKSLDLRKRINDHHTDGSHLTVTDILIWACGRVLERNPLLNASLKDDAILTFANININLAMDTQQGLVVPVIPNANRHTIIEIAEKREELAERVKNGTQAPEDMSGGTFTITNLGMFGIEQFDAIINPGQASILSVGMIKPTPVADKDGGIAIRPIIQLTLACDHRIADGADGARFLSDLKAILEDPEEMSKVE
jgi:pyruvate dehydrogenase E2 component (dihydrolipoamide acetyltransferase)